MNVDELRPSIAGAPDRPAPAAARDVLRGRRAVHSTARSERDRAAERAEDPVDSPEVNRLTDDIRPQNRPSKRSTTARGQNCQNGVAGRGGQPTEAWSSLYEERHMVETMNEAFASCRGTSSM